MMIHSLCSGFHWSYEQAKSLTLPQIIMLNHAAWVSHERLESKYAKNRSSNSKTKEPEDDLSGMDSNAMARYWDGFGSR